MHQGIARVAICFLAKFGFFYFFLTSIFAFTSMYVLVIYFTNVVSESGDSPTSVSKPVAPSHSQDGQQRSALDANNHFRITSNLKYLQTMWNSADSKTWGNYGRELMSFVNQTSMLPTCKQGSFLTIFITSAPRNFKARSAIRDSWCSENMTSVRLNQPGGAFKQRVIQCVFLLGKTLSKNIQRAIEIESRQNSDIVQGTYLDTYRNLTLKVLNGFQWNREHCPSSYMLKTDDDCFVNVPVLVKTLEDQAQTASRNLYVGHVMSDENKRQVIRDPHSKWEVSEDDFSPKLYPPYASGSGYLLSHDLVDVIVTLYDSTYFIPIEDAYMGIVLDSVGVRPIHSVRFSVHALQLQLCNLLYFVVLHKVTPPEQSDLMKQSFQSYAQCRQHEPVFDWN